MLASNVASKNDKGDSMRVLIAEDDKPVAMFLRKGLEAENYAVDLASDGKGALFMATEYEFDLVILDLNLPETDGLEVLRGLRAKKPNLPVIVLTQRSRVEDRVKGL